MLIWIIRHGESEGNKEKVFGKAFHLTPKGKIQAQWIRDYLKDKAIRAIYSSPLPRAAETADVIAAGLGIDYYIAESLREIEYGDLELMVRAN